MVLRFYIDKPGGISLADCEVVSREIGPLLDAEDFFSGQYLLEVSSPGLDRPVRREEDFRRFSGQKAKIELKTPVNGRRRLVGTILGADRGELRLLLGQGESVCVALANLKKANLVWEGESPPKAS